MNSIRSISETALPIDPALEVLPNDASTTDASNAPAADLIDSSTNDPTNSSTADPIDLSSKSEAPLSPHATECDLLDTDESSKETEGDSSAQPEAQIVDPTVDHPIVVSSEQTLDQNDSEEETSSSDEESSVCQSEMELSDHEEEKELKVLKTKNEIPQLPPLEKINVEIPMQEPLICVGRIEKFIQDNLVVVAADNSGDYQVLDMDSVLLTKDKKPIGKVMKIFKKLDI